MDNDSDRRGVADRQRDFLLYNSQKEISIIEVLLGQGRKRNRKQKGNEMNKQKNAAVVYWLGALLQMSIICIIAAILRQNQISYPPILDMLFMIIGGVSTALWGIIVSVKYKNITGLTILREFFHIKQPILSYGMVLIFILIIFGIPILRQSFVEGVQWYSFIILFLQAIVFGGIEEIGWRYTWQPIIERKVSFPLASIATFVSWGIWHYMYFYVTDTLGNMEHISFLIGLLGSCFILGAIYKVTKSLWLCVLYHCLLNVFSQTLQANQLGMVILCNAAGIIIACVIVWIDKQERCGKENDN